MRPSGRPEAKDWSVTEPMRREEIAARRLAKVPGRGGFAAAAVDMAAKHRIPSLRAALPTWLRHRRAARRSGLDRSPRPSPRAPLPHREAPPLGYFAETPRDAKIREPRVECPLRSGSRRA